MIKPVTAPAPEHHEFRPPQNPYAEKMDKEATKFADILSQAFERAYKDKEVKFEKG